jgi:hypothetical protein
MQQTSYTAWWFAKPQQPSKLSGILIALGAAGLAWVWLHRGAAEATPEVPTAAATPGWSGVWVNGNAMIRLRGLKGEYSPDGMAVIPFRARAQGNALWFSARLYGRQMSLCLTRSGETARLVGTQEYEPNRVPV